MTNRKTADVREKQLRLAIFRIERGRAHTKTAKLSVSAVAREAGVTPALIHNHYPSVAELIRLKLGATAREQRDAKQAELVEERKKNAELRKNLADLQAQIDRLATINEMLLVENKEYAARHGDTKVVPISAKKRSQR